MATKSDNVKTNMDELLDNTARQEQIFRALSNLIKQCIENNMCIKMVKHEEFGFGYLLKYFYDSNGCLLLPKDSGSFISITTLLDTDGKTTITRKKMIEDWETLTRENHYHWVNNNSNNKDIEKYFIETMVKLELIEVEKTVTIYKTKVKFD